MAGKFVLLDDEPEAGPAFAAEPAQAAAPPSGKFVLLDDEPVGVPAIEAGPPSPETAFAGLSPEQRSALAVEKLGPAEPASALEVAGNAVVGAGASVGDIPAGILQLGSRYLPLPDSVEQGADQIVADYEAQKKDALDRPGGTAGYVGGQIGTAFVPGTGPLKVLSTAGKVAKVAAAAKPIAAGVTLTALKPYETEADRAQAAGISAGLGAAVPAVMAGIGGVTRAVGEKIRPRPAAKPPGGIPPGPPPAGGAAPAGGPPGGAPPGAPPAAPVSGFSDRFIQKLKSVPKSQRRGELLESAQRLKVTLTPGKAGGGSYLEEQMQKLPGSRTIAERASRESHESYHRALGREMGLEDSPYLTKDVIEVGMKKLGDEYDEILPNIRMTKGTPITDKLVFETNKLVEPFGDLVAPSIVKSQARKLGNIKQGLDDQLANKGQITGEELKRWKTQIDKIARDKDLDPAVLERLEKFKESLKDTFATSLDETDPGLAARLRLNDKRYATAKILEKVQTAAGANVEGFVSGPQLLNAVVARYGNPSKVGDLGELADMGQMFFRKLPDTGSADRILANALLTGGAIGALGGASYTGLIDPSTAIQLGLLPKLGAHAYYGTRGYRNALAATRATASAGTRTGASGAGWTGRPEDRPRDALVH
jgi:hypothetical protein